MDFCQKLGQGCSTVEKGSRAARMLWPLKKCISHVNSEPIGAYSKQTNNCRIVSLNSNFKPFVKSSPSGTDRPRQGNNWRVEERCGGVEWGQLTKSRGRSHVLWVACSLSRKRVQSAWGAAPPALTPALWALAQQHGLLGWAQNWPSTLAHSAAHFPTENRKTTWCINL